MDILIYSTTSGLIERMGQIIADVSPASTGVETSHNTLTSPLRFCTRQLRSILYVTIQQYGQLPKHRNLHCLGFLGLQELQPVASQKLWREPASFCEGCTVSSVWHKACATAKSKKNIIRCAAERPISCPNTFGVKAHQVLPAQQVS